MRPLSLLETRVLGVLVEKSLTVPDSYPLSLNALTLGCNQKTARDPVLAASDAEVQGAVDALKALSLAFESSGSRVSRYEHNLGRVLGCRRSRWRCWRRSCCAGRRPRRSCARERAAASLRRRSAVERLSRRAGGARPRRRAARWRSSCRARPARASSAGRICSAVRSMRVHSRPQATASDRSGERAGGAEVAVSIAEAELDGCAGWSTGCTASSTFPLDRGQDAIRTSRAKKLTLEMVIPIRWGDMDAMGHVNNTIYFRYLEIVRIEWLHRSPARRIPAGEGPVIVNTFCNFLKRSSTPGLTSSTKHYVAMPGPERVEAYVKLRADGRSLGCCTRRAGRRRCGLNYRAGAVGAAAGGGRRALVGDSRTFSGT
jgi:hypothetical protein